MKKFFKIFIPLVLILCLLIGGGWFFFFERADLTADFLASRAVGLAERGSYTWAVRLNSWAERIGGSNPDYTLELADAYAGTGNYTKAEYTLIRAIAEHPDQTALYAALSQVYVAQDKLLDAQEMLDRISNPAAKAELDARRPAAPVLTPESGSYQDYTSVSAEYAGGVAYLTTDGAYPSLRRNAFIEPVALPEGESTVQALVVSNDGLVSPLTVGNYLVGNIVREVQLQDPAIKAAVQDLLGLEEGAALLSSDLWEIKEFTVPDDAASFEDLSLLSNLERLTVRDKSNFNGAFLVNLPKLQMLDLSGSVVSSADLACIASLTELRELYLAGCFLSNASVLGSLSNLRILDLSDNSVGALDFLNGMPNLIQLSLGGNDASSIAEVAALPLLESLDLSRNRVTDISALSGCTNLWTLNLTDCAVSDLSPLAQMTRLEELFASGNRISDVSPLGACSALRIIELDRNELTDIQPLGALTCLERLSLDENAVTEVPSFSADTPLYDFSAAYNQLTDISPLAVLTKINNVNIEYNNVADILVLSSCYTLVRVDAFGNPITDVAALVDAGVLVDYDPTYTPPEAEDEEGSDTEE